MKWMRRGLWFISLTLLLLLFTAWWLLRGSLAQLDGEQSLPGLQAPVTLSRDALGTVTIDASSADDMARALGFVHAQERFFQMDLLRRAAAGELSALVGAAALPMDRSRRAHRFRARAQKAMATLNASERSRLDAYRDGVNQGLNTLRTRPWEYFLLRQQPIAWSSEDSALVVYAMFFDLNSNGANLRELNLSRMHDVLPESLVQFLVQAGSEWDAPLVNAPIAAVAMPTAEAFDLRTQPAIVTSTKTAMREGTLDESKMLGSNQFAVSGSLSKNGAAWIADDMHLALGVPGIWFRAQLRYRDSTAVDGVVQLNGVTLPGVPALIAGSNGHIAWGFTNSYGDWTDWVRVRRDPKDPDHYLNDGISVAIETHREVLAVAGAADEYLLVHDTEWGPILATDTDGVELALRWTAHEPRALNMNMFRIDRITDVDAALALAPTLGMPAQNFMVGDRAGKIGWTLTGNAIPLRQGLDPQRPAEFSTGTVGWMGWLNSAETPRIDTPASHRLWTANARTQGDEALQLEGDGGYDLGARQQQIRDDLMATHSFSAAELLAIQLDDRAVFLQRWYQLLRDALQSAPEQKLRNLNIATSVWSGHASIDSVDYRITRAFRLNVIDAVMKPFVDQVTERHAEFALPSAQGYEAAVWAMIEAQPAHLLNPEYESWDALLLAAAERVEKELGEREGGIANRNWGERNTSAIRHPLSRALPGFLSRWLDMPAEALPGDSNMPRVQAPDFGASERFAIAPGHESESYLMMPGGQSPHPLSPFHAAGHEDWAKGIPTPLLPGPEVHRVMLK